jgi:hypothetical protein
MKIPRGAMKQNGVAWKGEPDKGGEEAKKAAEGPPRQPLFVMLRAAKNPLSWRYFGRVTLSEGKFGRLFRGLDKSRPEKSSWLYS